MVSAAPWHKPIAMFHVRVDNTAVDRVAAVLRSGYIGEGPAVKELEQGFRAVSGTPWNLAVNSGTSALHLALILAGVGSGDEVITTAQTMMATSHSIMMQGAKPVFADIQPETGNLDPADVERRVTPRSKAILPVHWAGLPCDMDEIHAVGRRHGLAVIEDAAHAIGASYKGQPIGSLSNATCFSLQAIKHVTSGDGGMLTLTHEADRDEGARLRWFGIDRDRRKETLLGEAEWLVTRLGYKYQMNDIAASVGLANLPGLGASLSRRRAIAARYRAGLSAVPGISLLRADQDRESAHWIYTLLVERRDDCVRHLRGKNIHPSVVHLRIDRHPLYGGLRADLAGLDWFTDRHLSLPIHDALTDDEVEFVIEALREGW